jgi:hypothetical protein
VFSTAEGRGRAVVRVQYHACSRADEMYETYVAELREGTLDMMTARVVPLLRRYGPCDSGGDGECRSWIKSCNVRHGMKLGKFSSLRGCMCNCFSMCLLCSSRVEGQCCPLWTLIDCRSVRRGRVTNDGLRADESPAVSVV